MFAAAPPNGRAARAMAVWLFACAAMVFAMVVLGGATRLTESGLSMVEWRPLTLLPPLTDAEWAAEFTAYQASPEGLKVNSWMEIGDFTEIYWLEYIHRLWGRMIGFAFALPMIWFQARREIDQEHFWKFLGLFALGGAQGVLGWYMVASGLIDRPDVSHYRLAAHLLTAFVCLGLLLWVALDLRKAGSRRGRTGTLEPQIETWAGGIALFALVVVTSGAFVAGLNAGKGFNTFPLMDGALIPDGLFQQSPWYMNWFENHMTIQFNHRVLAMTLVGLIFALWLKVRHIDRLHPARRWVNALAAMALVQAGLGIVTLLLVVPIGWALAHQTGAQLVFALAVATWWSVREERQATTTEHSRAFRNAPAE